ncbi:MAG: ROK family protein [Mycobacteriaceae bacterium]|nr:ROK family protein [Mycobacteriaceae bacterium]
MLGSPRVLHRYVLSPRSSPRLTAASLAWLGPANPTLKDIPVRTTALSSHPLLTRSQIVAPALGVPDAAAAVVFGAARVRGPIARDTIAQLTSLSIATVNRQVTALLDAGLLRERADLAVSGAIGRPRVPVELNHEPFVTLGMHVGARTTSIVAADLFGRTLDAVETPTPRAPQREALAALSDSARRYLSRWHRRRPLWIGVAVGGIVEGATGLVHHPRLGWTSAPLGPVLAQTMQLPVSVASHVDAMAGAELLLGLRRFSPASGRYSHGRSSSSLYVYARETVGYALVIDGKVHSPATGPGTIAALPVESELLGPSGRLESTVSDEAVLVAAGRLGVLADANPTMPALLRAARAGSEPAQEVLGERARVLGGAVALLRDMLNPDDLVVGGQAFTEYPEAMSRLRAAYTERSTLPARDIRVTALGNRVQEAGAGVVSLGGLYADPIGAMRRALGASPADGAAHRPEVSVL